MQAVAQLKAKLGEKPVHQHFLFAIDLAGITCRTTSGAAAAAAAVLIKRALITTLQDRLGDSLTIAGSAGRIGADAIDRRATLVDAGPHLVVLLDVKPDQAIGLIADLKLQCVATVYRHLAACNGSFRPENLFEVVNVQRERPRVQRCLGRLTGVGLVGGAAAAPTALAAPAAGVGVRRQVMPGLRTEIAMPSATTVQAAGTYLENLGAAQFFDLFGQVQPIAFLPQPGRLVVIAKELTSRVGLIRKLLLPETADLDQPATFDHLTQVLDRCMLGVLANRPGLLDSPKSINLNAKSLTSREFAAMVRRLGDRTRNLVVDLGRQDAAGSDADWQALCRSLSDLGIKVCLELGATLPGLAAGEGRRFPDLLKVTAGALADERQQGLPAAIAGAQKAGTVVMAKHVEAAKQIDAAREAGVHLFQGLLIDRLATGVPVGAGEIAEVCRKELEDCERLMTHRGALPAERVDGCVATTLGSVRRRLGRLITDRSDYGETGGAAELLERTQDLQAALRCRAA